MAPDDSTPRLSWVALASALLGVSAVVVGLLAPQEIPVLYVGVFAALVLGFLGLREVNVSEGRIRGRWLALIGLVLGGLGSAAAVIGIAAILTAHLAVSGQRAQCVENLRRIGQGLSQYQTKQGTFPPAGLPAPGLADEDRLSWLAGIIPYLGDRRSNPFFEQLTVKLDPKHSWKDPANAAALQNPVRLFLCPADPHFDPQHTPTPTNYVGLAGIDPGALTLPRSSPRAGVFGYDRGVAPADMVAGATNTMMVAETDHDLGPWPASGPPTARGLDPATDDYIGVDRPFGGLHRDGMNVLWGDLSVRWVSERINPALFRRQATLKGPEP
jgi:hypothetical protein